MTQESDKQKLKRLEGTLSYIRTQAVAAMNGEQDALTVCKVIKMNVDKAQEPPFEITRTELFRSTYYYD